MCAFAERRLHDPAEAQDIAQETMHRTVVAVRSGRVEDLEALPAYIYETARHLCQARERAARRGARALSRIATTLGESADRDPLDALLSEERCVLVDLALARLAPDDRALLSLLYFEGLSHAAAARRLVVSSVALRVRKHRALRRLASLFSDETRPSRSEEGRTAHRTL